MSDLGAFLLPFYFLVCSSHERVALEEIFVIPKGWEEKKLESLCHSITDCHHSTPVWTKSGFVVIRTQNIKNGAIDLSSPSFTDEKHYLERISRAIPEFGDLILTREAPAGEIGIVPKNPLICLGQRLVLIKPNLAKVCSEFVKFFLLSDFIQYNTFKLQSNGSTVQNIRIPTIKNMILWCPPLEEQRQIALILSTWDAALDSLEKLIALKLELKRGLMQQLLTGRKRFKEFENGEWKNRKISTVIRESRLFGSTGEVAKKITVKLYGKGVLAKEEKRLGSENTKYYSRRSGQFIYSKLDFLNGAFGIIPNELNGFESTLDLPCFDWLENIQPKFFLYFVSRVEFYDNFQAGAIGGRIARRVQVDEFLDTEISIPSSLEEQQRIAMVLSCLDSEIETLRSSQKASKEQKKGLMQQLLTGRTRVKIETK
jgi:type I restriction enzyme, S subunit